MKCLTKLTELLKTKQLTFSAAESCTGGLLSAALTERPGSSAYFLCGMVTYSNEAKINLLNVPRDIIDTHGAVSKETALHMAKGVQTLTQSSVAVSITGIAGPGGGSLRKPVGLVHMAVVYQDTFEQKAFLFTGNRNQIRRKSVSQAVKMVTRIIS